MANNNDSTADNPSAESDDDGYTEISLDELLGCFEVQEQ